MQMFKLLLFSLLVLATHILHAQENVDTFTVTYVIDGDTFGGVNASGEEKRFRPIGVDTPETGYRDGRPEPYHEEATAFTKNLLLNKSIRIVYDVQSHDRYSRDLVYVYLMDGTFFNEEIMRAGWAQTMTIPPNVRHADLFLETQKDARNQGRGVWQ